MRSINLGRWSRRVERYFNIKGGGGLVDVDPSVRIVLPMIAGGVDDRYLEGVESFAATGIQGGVAANKSAVMIRNPTGSNMILVVEKIAVSGSAAEDFFLCAAGSNPADLATPISNFTRADPRSRSAGSALVSMAAPATDPGTGFVGLGNIGGGTTNVDLILYPNQEIVLLPQIALRVVGQVVNTTMNWTLFWRERPLEASELT